MKMKGTFMKSQAIDHKIVAVKAELGQLKGKLELSTNRQAPRRLKKVPTSNARRRTQHGIRCLPRQANH